MNLIAALEQAVEYVSAGGERPEEITPRAVESANDRALAQLQGVMAGVRKST